MDTLLGRCFFWMVTAHGIPGVIAVAAGIVHPHALVAVCKRPWLPSRSRGDGDGCASSLFLFFRTELPATTEGSDGDVTPRKDTREDFGLSFKLCPPSTVVGWL